MTELDDVDPANGTEAVVDSAASGGGVGDLPIAEPERGMPAGEIPPAGPPDRFTAPEKIVSVVQAVQSRPSADPKVAAVMRALNYRMVRAVVVDPVLGMLPPLNAPDEWDAWLASLVGVALELVSDGVEVDVDQCRQNARQLLASLFEAP